MKNDDHIMLSDEQIDEIIDHAAEPGTATRSLLTHVIRTSLNAGFREMLKSYTELHPDTDLPQWIPVEEKRPQSIDGNMHGEVLWLMNDGSVVSKGYNSNPAGHWMPHNVLDDLPKKPAADKNAKFKAWWASASEEEKMAAANLSWEQVRKDEK